MTPTPPDKTLEELVACPCCDAPAELDRQRGYRSLRDGHIGKAVAIYCLKCGLEISMPHEDFPEYDVEGLVQTLVAKWNVRMFPEAAFTHLTAQLEEERERCKRDVCMYCDGRAIGYNRIPDGPNEAGNWTHQYTATMRTQDRALCVASAIFARQAFNKQKESNAH